MTAPGRKGRPPLLALVGLVVWLLAIGAAVFLGDWKLAVYGVLAFLILGIIGALLPQNGPR